MAQGNTRRSLLGLLAWLALLAAAAALGSLASLDASTFYAALTRPDWAPPAWVFGPAWTTLYTLMAIAAWLVWREPSSSRVRTALTLFLAQLVLNVLWSWLFFGWRLGLASVLEIGLLWIAIVATIVAFWRVRRLAAVLLLPYIAWVSFAAALNFTIWRMNPGLLS
jgi:tryptophan-rich sensory protein